MSASAAHAIEVQEYSTAWVQEAARAAVVEAILADVPVGEEAVDVRIKPGFNTACWTYLPPHRVYVGDGIPKKAREGLTPEQMKRYIAKYVFHEFAHALETERDLEQVQQDLQGIAPFRLFNLFEDARIEEWFRTTYDIRFEWTEFERIDVSSKAPLAVFFAFIQCEGDAAAVRALTQPAEIPEELVAEIEGFYLRAIEAGSSQALYPILKEWVARFGVPPESDSQTPEDLSLGLVLQGNPEIREQFDQDTVHANGKMKLKGGSAGAPESVKVEKTEGNAELLVEARTAVDLERVRRLADRLARFFASESRTVSTEVPTKRISVRNYVLGRPFYRRQEIKSHRRRKVLVIVDCSGSMEGHHIQEGRVLLAALSELARRGIVSGHVVLSCVLDDKSRWQRFELPMQLSSIERIEAYGDAEGLEFSIRQNLKQAQQADFVLVYTDGQICDSPIKKRVLHSRGVYTWGLYAGHDMSRLERLTEYFDKAILRSDAEHLVEAMLVHA